MEDDTLVDTVTEGGGDEAAVLERGTAVGRYVILELVGSGAMGAVYSAYDPELDRKVAIKVLHTRRRGERRADIHRERLRREAQSLARLSHPHVVAIHDVGEFDDQIFVAMDFIDGEDLGSWAGGHSWEEVLAVYLQAGRGLAAAHAAGLVHRDFKPANVIVDTKQRARVVDFGVARTAAADPEEELPPPSPLPATASGSGTIEDRLTHAGALVGTPAYMSPEQHLGEDAGHRSDQFSFCLALYEGLYGRSAFEGESLPSRAFHVTQGQVVEPPEDAAPPRAVFEPIRRGLSVHPESRWPDMEALLDALELAAHPRVAPPPRSERGPLVAGLLATAVVLGLAFLIPRGSTGPCKGAEDRLAGAWDAGRRAELGATFVALDRPFAARTWSEVEARLDRYAGEWAAAWTESCEATRIEGHQSAELMDLRAACLDGLRDELAATTQVLTTANAAVIERAVEAVDALTPIATCSETARLRGLPSRPTDPRARGELEQIEIELAQIKALERTGLWADAALRAEPLLARAESTGYAPTIAECAFAHGEALENDGAYEAAAAAYLRADTAAEEAGDLRMQARARAAMAMIVGDRGARVADGLHWVELARAAQRRLGPDPRLESEIESIHAHVLDRAGLYQEVLEHKRQALALLEGQPEADPLQTASVHNNLSGTLAQLGNHDEALEHGREARRLWTEALGPDHPRVAIALASLALVHDYRGDYEASLDLNTQALEILERALGKDHVRVAEVLSNLAITRVDMGDLEQAEADFRRVYELKRHHYGDEHLEVASAAGNLGSLLRLRGKIDEATELAGVALRMREKLLPPDHPQLAISVASMANLLEDQKRYPEALPLRRRALSLVEKRYGPSNPAIVVELGNLAYTLTWGGDPEAALPFARRAARVVEENETKPDVEAFAHLAFANALWHQGSGASREAAREQAVLARDAIGTHACTSERALFDQLRDAAGWSEIEPQPPAE